MKKVWFAAFVLILGACRSENNVERESLQQLAEQVKQETLRSWMAYEKYAWGHDNLRPLSKGYDDWYEDPLYISLIDAYSTLKIMGLENEADRIERFVADSLSFDKDIFVKTFEVNIRVLGGLLGMYDLTGNLKILMKAEDFAKRILPAFESDSGMPYYYVNLKSGAVKGDTICTAEAGSYLLEMGVLSYYTSNPLYYQTAIESTRAVYDLRSSIDLVNQNFSVSNNLALDSIAQVGCFVDSYYEYLFKAWLLFGDEEVGQMWEKSIIAIDRYIASESDTSLWYGVVNSHSGELLRSHVTLWDAYFPALLVLSGDTVKAEKSQKTWNAVWQKYGALPMGYDYQKEEITNASYYLNPELIESAYYLWHFTGDTVYLDMLKSYYRDINENCKTDIAYAHLENVETKEQSDGLSTFFFAETMKYFYLAFHEAADVNPGTHVFSTEAHPFIRSHFDPAEVKIRLGIN